MNDAGVSGLILAALGVFLVLHYYMRRHMRRTEDILAGLLDACGYGRVIFSSDGRLVAANEAAQEVFGILLRGEVKCTLQQFLDFMYDHAADVDATLRHAVLHSLEYFDAQGCNFQEVVKMDGEKLYLIVMQKTPSGRHTILQINDISRQWRQEASVHLLGERNYQLLLAIEASHIGVLISTPKKSGNPISFANSAMAEMTGIAKDDIIGGFWFKLCAVFEEEDFSEQLLRAFHRQKTAEIVLTRAGAEGSLHWYSFVITPVFDENGALDLFIGVLKDTTAFKVREAEFFQAQKLEALGRLSAGIAHDFNNILSIIDGYARLARRNVRSNPADCEDYLERVCIATQRGAALTKRMLTFSRHKVVAEKLCVLGQIVRDQELLLGAVLDPSIRMFVDIVQDDVCVKGEPDILAQILMNLVINARDAIGRDGGVISIRVEKVDASGLIGDAAAKITGGPCAVLSVMDNGCGMEPHIVNRIFDPFFTTKAGEKGTGLGMSVVYGLVKDLGGHIDVQSAPGEGTSISVYLPLAASSARAQNAAPREAGAPIDLSGFTAMVVDDEPDIRAVTVAMLREAGMEVLSAENGDDALDRQDLYEGRIDILISDVLMPELGGVKLAELFLSLRPETQVLFISGYPLGEGDDQIQIPDHAHFLVKPVAFDKLAGLIMRLLGKDGHTADEGMDHWHNTAGGSQY